MTRPRVLIEDWLPIEELGIESRREAAPIPGQFPKIKTLHVWWARRPLAASVGAVLASVMPPWSPGLADAFSDRPELSSNERYRKWFLHLCGIWGDPVAAKQAQKAAIAAGVRVPNPYTYRPAFKNSPTTADLALLHRVFMHSWGALPVLLDPTAGGGSIPYEAIRYGIPVTANDLNSVAAVILRAGVETPTLFGPKLLDDLSKWGTVLVDRIVKRLAPFFRSGPKEHPATYLFARTVACPRTGKPVPLSPNWWIASKTGEEIAVRVLTERHGVLLDVPEFKILFGRDASASNPDKGTIAGGDAISPWDGLAIEGDYIKAEACAGRMGSLLYAVSVRMPAQASTGRTRWVRTFRPPTSIDLEVLDAAESELRQLLPSWKRSGIVPDERRYIGPADRSANYGIVSHTDLFSPRQLLVHGTFVEEFRRLMPEVQESLEEVRGKAVLGLLAFMQAKALNSNALLSSWDASRDKIRSVFDRHDFSFKWTFAEFEGAEELYPWCLEQLIDAYKEIDSLLSPSDGSRVAMVALQHRVPGPVRVLRENAGALLSVADQSQTLVCIDPPYYDNVMYGELSDFFGAWEQHTVGLVWGDLMPGGLADIKSEAVANVARFADTGRRRKALATADYEAKMGAIFAECQRVLRDDGVMTVMFTHKKAEAWDTLGMGLMEAGFTIETSWPINTESEQSLHQAKKNSAASTIMLVCRKREARSGSHPFFEDLEADVRREARAAVARFSAAGLVGVDLLLSTYGPVLSVISSQWPVYSSDADPVTGKSRLLRPEEALAAAREEVVRLQRRSLIGREIEMDVLTDFTLLAWSTFRAAEFPFDEARRLALAVGGLDVDELVSARLVTKKSGTVVLTDPKQRLRRIGDHKPGVHPTADSFGMPIIDALHTVLYVAGADGLDAAKALIDRTSLTNDSRFLACLQGLVNAIPRTKDKGKWVRAEAGILDALVTAYFPEIDVPEEWTGKLDLGV